VPAIEALRAIKTALYTGEARAAAFAELIAIVDYSSSKTCNHLYMGPQEEEKMRYISNSNIKRTRRSSCFC
jgi:hypothetical protein